MNKRTREISKLADQFGLDVVIGKNHMKLQGDDGFMIVCSKTPSDSRSDRNLLAFIKRKFK